MCLAVTCLAVDSVDGHVVHLGLLTSVHVAFLRVGTFSLHVSYGSWTSNMTTKENIPS